MKQRLLSGLILLGTVASAWSQANTTANWGNFSLDATTQSMILLRDAAGVPLSQGTATVNTDGFLVQLGYYSMATVGNNFAGVWIPITGAIGTANPTTVGDSPDLSGFGNGVISFNTGFTLNTTNVQVYAPADAGDYITQSSIQITGTTPPANQIMAIRFYDTTTGTTGFYNAVSADDWTWQVPTTVGGGAIVNYDMEAAFLGIGLALEFEVGGPGAFRTVIPVPEPSTYALFFLGLATAAYARRRLKAKA